MLSVKSAALPARAAVRMSGPAAFVLIVSLFFLWGMANNLNDILIKQFKKAFELSDFKAGLVQSAFYLGYFALALPAGLCTRRLGYKGALLIGLVLYAGGAFLFYPAAEIRGYGLFLAALFVIASGLAFLETSANPLVTVMGDPEGAARRLNLAQSFNPLGSIAGVLIGQHFILSGVELSPADLAALLPQARDAYLSVETRAVQGPYLVVGAIALLWALLIAVTRIPAVEGTDAVEAGAAQSSVPQSSPPGSRSLWRMRNFMFAVGAQFLYVGAQVGVWSFLIRYTQAEVPGTPEKSAANFLTGSLLAFMVGRFVGTAAMRFAAPSRILAIYGVAACGLVGFAILHPGQSGVWALVATSFFMSVMFPTLFALGLDGLGTTERKLGASFLVMAIIGGAVLTALMGAISDVAGIANAMSVPLACFAAVAAFALYTEKGRLSGNREQP